MRERDKERKLQAELLRASLLLPPPPLITSPSPPFSSLLSHLVFVTYTHTQMPGRKGFRGSGGKDEAGSGEGGGGGGTRNYFATFWANASYKSFAKPHFREASTEDDLDEAEGAFPPRHATTRGAVGRGPGVSGGRRHYHHGELPYDSSDSIPSLSHHSSSSNSDGHSDNNNNNNDSSHTNLSRGRGGGDLDLERGGGGLAPVPLSPAPRSLRIPDKRTPSGKFTTHQLLYVFGSHGVGAFVISGGINFAIAYGKPFLSCPFFIL